MKLNLTKKKKENSQQLFLLIRELQLKKEAVKYGFCVPIKPNPSVKGASVKLKKEAAKYGFCFLIKPNPSVFQRLRSDKDRIEINETAGIYRLNFINENNEKGCYIGKTKHKIKKRISEHERDIRLNKGNTVIAQISQRENIKINFKTPQKIANYVNENLSLKREVIEILSCKAACKTREHVSIEQSWLHAMRRKDKWRKERRRSFQAS